MLHSNGKTTDNKARDLIAAGRVRLTEGGASVTNDAGHVYRVDFDLGGQPHCQCKGFEHTGWCKHLTAAYMAQSAPRCWRLRNSSSSKHLTAAYMAQSAASGKSEDEPMTDEEEDRMREYILDAGLDYGDMGSAAYALGW